MPPTNLREQLEVSHRGLVVHDPRMTVDEYLASLGIGPDVVARRLDELRAHVTAEVEAVEAAAAAGNPVIPEIDMAHVVDGTVPASAIAAVHRRGCVVVRGTFERAEAEAWDAEIAHYVSRNAFRERFEAHNAEAATGSRIWGVYWSRPQVAARQHPRMVAARRFLNRLWSLDAPGGPGGVWFDPDTDIGYPDRVRRREPGADSRGLGMHVDTPAIGGWTILENQRVFAPLLTRGIDGFDPWNPAHRTVLPVESPVGCSVFRTFQGWTALSDMEPDDGVLHLVPIPLAVAHRFVVGLAGELGLDGEPRPAPRRDHGDELLARALVPIPAVAPGDTVWWHGDLFHSVADASNHVRWGNVMYIGASPWCERNAAYQPDHLERFRRGASPRDFPPEDFELDFAGRATVDDLSDTGRAQFGLAPQGSG